MNSDGYTALHLACKADNPSRVNILLSEAHCDPNCLDGNGKTPLQVTSSSRILTKLLEHGAKMPADVVFKLITSSEKDSDICEVLALAIRKQSMLWNPNELNSDGYTALHLACKTNKLAIVSYLIDQAHCDPNIKNNTGSLPLDMTTYPRIINYLCQHDQVAVYSKTIVRWMNTGWTMFPILKSLVENHRYKTEDGSTLLHVLCMHIFFRSYKERFVDFLLTECHCDPNCLDSNGKMPLQVTSSPRIMTKLIEHGAKMTADVVSKLITSSNVDSIKVEILTLAIRKQAMQWNPNELNGDGYTALHLACKADNPNTVNILLSEAHCDPNCLDGNGKTPLQVTSSPRIMTKLLEHGAKMPADVVFKLITSNEKDSDICEVLTLAIRKQSMLWNPNELNSDGYTALHLACKTNKLAIVSYLIDQAHCDPNIKNNTGSLPLDMTTYPRIINYLCQHDQVAVYSKTIVRWMNTGWTMFPILKSLVENHRYKTEDGSTLLHVLCMHIFFRSYKERFVDFLLTECHCDPNCLDSIGKMPLQVTSSPRIMTKLIEHGAKMTADVVFKLITSSNIDSIKVEILTLAIRKQAMRWNPNELNGDGYTALHLACKADNPSIVNILFSEAHCDPNCLDGNGKTPLQVTSSSRILTKLLEHGAKMPADVVFKLITSSEKDSDICEVLALAIRKQSMLWNPNELNSDGYTALHLACKTNKLAIVSYLIDQAHCDPNIKNNTGSLPLDMTTYPRIINYLCQHDQVAVYSKTIVRWMNTGWTMFPILKSLVENHRYKTEDGSTLLHVLCMHIFFRSYKERFVDFLLTECHCDPNCLDSNGKMPLQVTSSPRIMTKLIEHGAKMTADVVSKLITSSNVDSIKVEILTLAIRKQAMQWNPNELNGDGYTALHLACKADNPNTVNILLSEAHCDPNCLDGNGKTPLQVTSSPRIMTKLLEHGAKMPADVVFKLITSSEKDSDICEVLTLAIRKQVMRWNPNELNGDGYTALHLACKADNPNTVNILLSEAHCDPNCLDGNGKTPLQVTSSPRIMTKLLEHGAKMPADVVFKLITSSEKDSDICEVLTLAIRKQAMRWNPNELNSDGYTALHLACKADNPSTVNILLSGAHCDPNCLDGNGKNATSGNFRFKNHDKTS